MAYKFEIYRDKKNEFRFRFVAPNGEKMFASEGYVSKASAKSTIKSIVKHVAAAAVDDVSKAKKAAAAPKPKKVKAKKATKSKKATKRGKKARR
ncbi:YegP family protein [Nitrobacteraceae bacterium UC4446_H13]